MFNCVFLSVDGLINGVPLFDGLQVDKAVTVKPLEIGKKKKHDRSFLLSVKYTCRYK